MSDATEQFTQLAGHLMDQADEQLTEAEVEQSEGRSKDACVALAAARALRLAARAVRATAEDTTPDAGPESIIGRLKSLKRYIVGEAEDGGGYRYEYNDESPSGDWIAASDVGELIKWIEQNAAGEETP